MDGQRGEDQDHVEGVQRIQRYEGEELDVVLSDLPGAGYEWAPRSVPSGLVLLAADWATPVPPAVGASRGRTFRFRAERAGTYELLFDLRRPWEPHDVPPPERHVVSVVVLTP